MKLRADRLCREDVDGDGGLVGASVDAQALVGVSGEGAFDGSGADARAAGRHEVVQNGPAGLPPAAYTWGQLMTRLKDYAETGAAQPLFIA
jgi:hypothetical protein